MTVNPRAARRLLLALLAALLLAGALLPLADSAGAVPPPPGVGTSTFVNRWRSCPPGTNLAALSYRELDARCTGSRVGVGYTLFHPVYGNLYGRVNTTLTAAGTIAKFTGVPAGQITAKEQKVFSNGVSLFSAPVVHCGFGALKPAVKVTDVAASITVPVADNSFVWCDWFHVPA
jgi:hypothetical protein